MKKNKKPVIAYLHTHWDPEWYRTLQAFDVRLVQIFDKVLNALKTGEIPCFYFDGQVLALLRYLKYRPECEKIIRKFIKEKKLFIGPHFASVDSFLVSGASLIKNLEYGLKISKQFGEDEFLGYMSDTFGHSKGIFEILNYFGIENAIIWRGAAKIPADFMVHHTKVARLVYGYYQDVLHNNSSIEKKAEIITKILDKINEKSGGVLLLPLGADHLSIPDFPARMIEKINEHLENYEIILQNPFEYFKRADFSKTKLECEFLDNSETFILQGVYSARIPEKAENSRLQFELFNKIQPLNCFLGGKYQKELDIAGRELVKNHAHDSIYGCSIDPVHQAVRARQTSVRETVQAVTSYLMRDFKNKYLISENKDMAGVFNLSAYPAGGVVKIISDKKLKNAQKIRQFKSVSEDIMSNLLQNPMTEDFHDFFEYLIEVDEIPAFSFKNVKIKPPVQKTAIGDDFIENENLKLCVSDGEIYVLDKKYGTTYFNFIELHSTKDGGDSYNFAPLEPPKVLKLKGSKKKVCGSIKSTLELKFEENIKLNVSLSNNSEFFEIEAEFNNKKKNRMLQIAINTGSPVTKTVAEDSISTIERAHDPNYSLYEAMPAPPKTELKTNAYPMGRFVVANGVCAITKGLLEYEICKNSIKIPLLRSTGIISNPKNPARSVPAGPPIECPEMQELGYKKVCLAILFNKNPRKQADLFYNPFVSLLGEFKIKNKTFLKPPENSIFYGMTEKGGAKKPLFYNEKTKNFQN